MGQASEEEAEADAEGVRLPAGVSLVMVSASNISGVAELESKEAVEAMSD